LIEMYLVAISTQVSLAAARSSFSTRSHGHYLDYYCVSLSYLARNLRHDDPQASFETIENVPWSRFRSERNMDPASLPVRLTFASPPDGLVAFASRTTLSIPNDLE